MTIRKVRAVDVTERGGLFGIVDGTGVDIRKPRGGEVGRSYFYEIELSVVLGEPRDVFVEVEGDLATLLIPEDLQEKIISRFDLYNIIHTTKKKQSEEYGPQYGDDYSMRMHLLFKGNPQSRLFNSPIAREIVRALLGIEGFKAINPHDYPPYEEDAIHVPGFPCKQVLEEVHYLRNAGLLDETPENYMNPPGYAFASEMIIKENDIEFVKNPELRVLLGDLLDTIESMYG